MAMAAFPSAARALPTVKPEPTDPEHAGTGNRQRYVVGDDLLRGEALSLSNDQCSNDCGNPCGNVNDSATGEVEEPAFEEPSAF